MTREEVIKLIRGVIDEAGNQIRAAEQMGISPTVLSRVLKGRDDPPPKLLAYFDIDKVIVYRKK